MSPAWVVLCCCPACLGKDSNPKPQGFTWGLLPREMRICRVPLPGNSPRYPDQGQEKEPSMMTGHYSVSGCSVCDISLKPCNSRAVCNGISSPLLTTQRNFLSLRGNDLSEISLAVTFSVLVTASARASPTTADRVILHLSSDFIWMKTNIFLRDPPVRDSRVDRGCFSRLHPANAWCAAVYCGLSNRFSNNPDVGVQRRRQGCCLVKHSHKAISQTFPPQH